MPWYGWLSLAVSLTGYVIAWRYLAWFLVDDIVGGDWNRVDSEDLVMGIFIGALLAAFWPVIVVGFLGYRLIQLSGLTFIQAPPHIRKQRELAARERRIEQLEREVGLR